MLLPEIYKKLDQIEFNGKQPVLNKLKVIIMVLERQEATVKFCKDSKPKFNIKSDKEPGKRRDEENKETINKSVRLN